MDPRAESLIRRFADVGSGEEVVTTVLGGGRSRTVRRPHAEIAELLPEQGVVAITHGDRTARPHLAEAELLRAGAGRSGSAAWGESLSDEEAAARFPSVRLDESPATRDPHPSGWWSRRGAGFDPVPPWEAHHRRKPPSGH